MFLTFNSGLLWERNPAEHQRFMRNLAEHHGIGCGSAGVEEMMRVPQARQRGGRRGRGVAGNSSMRPDDCILTPSPADGSHVSEGISGSHDRDDSG